MQLCHLLTHFNFCVGVEPSHYFESANTIKLSSYTGSCLVDLWGGALQNPERPHRCIIGDTRKCAAVGSTQHSAETNAPSSHLPANHSGTWISRLELSDPLVQS